MASNNERHASLDAQARYQQMLINTRLTALQAAQMLMGTPGYKDKAGSEVDHVTLLVVSTDIEEYILKGISAPTPPSNLLKVG